MTYTTWGPWTCENVPLMDSYMRLAPLIQPPLFAVAGIAHFAAHHQFARFYPHKARPARLCRSVGVSAEPESARGGLQCIVHGAACNA